MVILFIFGVDNVDELFWNSIFVGGDGFDVDMVIV